MRYIVPFYKRSDVYRYKWIKTGESVKVVVPHPKLADSMREIGVRYRPDLDIDSMTIAEFIKKEISHFNSDITICKKYQLILELSTIWKKYSSQGSYEGFLGVFDSFTQLRGITTDFGLIEDILNKSYMGLKEADVENIKRFWKYLEIRKIYDEHAVCSYLVEKYRNFMKERVSENFVFYGFSHVSSGQCDLFNVMGDLHDIYIPLYSDVWNMAEESDWVKWVDAEVLQIPLKKRKAKEIDLVKIGKNGLSQATGELLNRHYRDKSVEIILTQKNPDFFHVGELAWGEVFFKIEASIFLNTYTKIFNDMELELDWEKTVETELVLKLLKEIARKELNKKFDEKDFKVIKVASFIHDEVKTWMDLSEENSSMKIFDYHVFRNALKLNLPRNYILPRTGREMETRARGLEDIETVGTDKFVILCVTTNYRNFDFSEDHWTEKMIESFLKIGPVRRKELEFAILKENIMDIFSENASLLLIEDGLIEENPLWSDILSNFDVNEITLESLEEREKRDYIKSLDKKQYSLSKTEKWSSSKIQKHLDCPRSFYYSYVDRIYFSPENQQEVEAKYLGSLQHKVIRLFMEQSDALNEEGYDDLAKNIWENFLQEKKLFLDDLSYKNYFIEIKNYSWRGIKTLLEIKKHYPGANFSFEVEFSSNMHRGSIDCVINLGDGRTGIVDFKRSVSSIPSWSDTLNFKKIQIWYYMHNMRLEGRQLCFLGYLCLSELEKSQFFFDKDVFTAETFGRIFSGKKGKSCSMEDKRVEFGEFLEDKIGNILEDKKFLPIPQSHTVCNYCWMDKVCVRENIQ